MIAILGAGISGLSLAYYLKKNGCTDYKVFEKSTRFGGKIQSKVEDDYYLEFGPNTLLTSPLLLELIAELNLNSQIVYPKEEIIKNRFIGVDDKIIQLPTKPQQLLFNKILSFRTKISILKELKFKPSPVPKKQTVSAFFNAHFDQEIVEKLVKSFCNGIYGSSSDDLLIHTCFPNLVKYQEKHGSIIKGMKANNSIEKRKVISLKGGLTSLCQALYQAIEPNVSLGKNIQKITKKEDYFELDIDGEIVKADQVIFCCDAKSIAQYTQKTLPKTSLSLENVNYTALRVTHSIYNKPKNTFPFNGFGVLLPPSQSKNMFGNIWNSAMLTDFPEDKTIITTMSSTIDKKTLDNEIDTYFSKHFNLNKKQLKERIRTDWNQAIPKYDSQHQEFLEIFETENKLKLYICSNLVNGVSIPDRLSESDKLSHKLLQ